jgi:hypothetical protein
MQGSIVVAEYLTWGGCALFDKREWVESLLVGNSFKIA